MSLDKKQAAMRKRWKPSRSAKKAKPVVIAPPAACKPCNALHEELRGEVSLSEAGIERLIQQAHDDIQKIRAMRGLPPYDFSKPALATGEKMREWHAKKRKAANA